jgi:hypothetical protein
MQIKWFTCFKFTTFRFISARPNTEVLSEKLSYRHPIILKEELARGLHINNPIFYNLTQVRISAGYNLLKLWDMPYTGWTNY